VTHRPPQNALVVIPLKKRIGRANRIVVFLPFEARLSNPELISILLQLAGAAFLAGHAVIWMVGQEKLNHLLSGLLDPFGVSLHHHLIGDRVGARSY